MTSEDETKVTRLITDYMCWWDDRIQHKDYPAQLDENATWELWQQKGSRNLLFDQHRGKNAILSVKKSNSPMVHSTTNIVIHSVDEDRAEARAYFRTYFRSDGRLWTHGEGQYTLSRVGPEWRLMAIKNQYYSINCREHRWAEALKISGLLAAATVMGAVGGRFL